MLRRQRSVGDFNLSIVISGRSLYSLGREISPFPIQEMEFANRCYLKAAVSEKHTVALRIDPLSVPPTIGSTVAAVSRN